MTAAESASPVTKWVRIVVKVANWFSLLSYLLVCQPFGRFVAVNKDVTSRLRADREAAKSRVVPMSSNHPPPPCPPPDLIQELSQVPTSFSHPFRNKDVGGRGKPT